MRLTVTAHLTLDGVMQSNGKPEPELKDGFEQGGWQVPYFDADLDRMTGDWIAAADAFLLGGRPMSCSRTGPPRPPPGSSARRPRAAGRRSRLPAGWRAGVWHGRR